MKVQKAHSKRVIETACTRYVIQVSASDTDGVISLYEATFKCVREEMKLHYHQKLTETFTVLRGSFMFNVNGEDCELGANDTLIVRPCETHGFRALAPQSTLLISFSNGPNRDDFFTELADRVNKGKQ